MTMATGGGGASAPQMNVTPLIDVLLVLIIIFMVIVAQSKEKGLEAQIPQPPANSNATPPPVRTIVIQLAEAKNGAPELKINEQSVSWADLKPQLADIFKQRAERVAFVQGDDEVDFEYVADVIDTARAAGVDKSRIAPKRDGGETITTSVETRRTPVFTAPPVPTRLRCRNRTPREQARSA